MTIYYTTGDVSKMAGVQAKTVKNWLRKGWLKPQAKTPFGTRLFTLAYVRRFLAARAKQRKALGLDR